MSTPVQIKKIIKDFLDELSDADLVAFQWYVVQNRRDGCKPIPRALLEKATREQTVDVLEQTYGEDGAWQTTVDILFRMSQNDIAIRLTTAIICRSQEEQRPCQQSPSDSNQIVDLSNHQDLICGVCCEMFTSPVVLQCGHSFCKTCFHSCRERSFRCPVCKQVFPDEDPPINFALKGLIDNYNKGGKQAAPSGQQSRNSLAFQTSKRTVKEKHKAFKKVKKFCRSSVKYIENQARNTEEKITEDFEELHQFLFNEEEARIAAVREEATKKIDLLKQMVELSRDTLSLSDTLNTIQDLGAEPSFLQNFKTEMGKTQGSLPDPQQLPHALMDVSQHVGNLQFKVWEKMKSIIKHTPVVLDPNTAHPSLSLSEDLTTVRVTKACQQQPKNLERSTRHPQVLGRKGFSSGEHCWEVAVGKSSRWTLGLADKTVARKKLHSEYGFWTVTRHKEKYKDAFGKTLRLQERPEKIRIKLNYEEGTVSFHDAERNTLIFKYEDTFTQELHPYFAFVETDNKHDDDGSSGKGIQICESKVSVTLSHD